MSSGIMVIKPSSPETVIVSYAGMEPFQAEPLKVGSFYVKTPSLLEFSRLLEALEKRHEETVSRRADAIS